MIQQNQDDGSYVVQTDNCHNIYPQQYLQYASPGGDVQVRVSALEQLPRDLGELGEEVLAVYPRLELVGAALHRGDEKRGRI